MNELKMIINFDRLAPLGNFMDTTWNNLETTRQHMEAACTTASRPTKVNGWKFTHLGWISTHWLETQPLVGKPTTMSLEF